MQQKVCVPLREGRGSCLPTPFAKQNTARCCTLQRQRRLRLQRRLSCVFTFQRWSCFCAAGRWSGGCAGSTDARVGGHMGPAAPPGGADANRAESFRPEPRGRVGSVRSQVWTAHRRHFMRVCGGGGGTAEGTLVSVPVGCCTRALWKNAALNGAATGSPFFIGHEPRLFRVQMPWDTGRFPAFDARV